MSSHPPRPPVLDYVSNVTVDAHLVTDAHLIDLRRVLREYTDYYNTARPHQGLAQQAPIPFPRGSSHGAIHCHDVLGGILHDYRREAA